MPFEQPPQSTSPEQQEKPDNKETMTVQPEQQEALAPTPQEKGRNWLQSMKDAFEDARLQLDIKESFKKAGRLAYTAASTAFLLSTARMTLGDPEAIANAGKPLLLYFWASLTLSNVIVFTTPEWSQLLMRKGKQKPEDNLSA